MKFRGPETGLQMKTPPEVRGCFHWILQPQPLPRQITESLALGLEGLGTKYLGKLGSRSCRSVVLPQLESEGLLGAVSVQALVDLDSEPAG